MLALLALVVPSADAGSVGRPASVIEAADGVVRAHDLASASPNGDAIVMTLPERAASAEVSEAKRRELLRAAFPGGRFALRQNGPVRVVRKSGPRTARAGGPCYASGAAIAQDDAISQGDLLSVACRGGPSGRYLRYDAAAGAFFARRAIAAGAYLGPVKLATGAGAKKGAELVYRTAEGPVVVERKVVALQPARPGRRVFVRTDDGRVLVSTLERGEDR